MPDAEMPDADPPVAEVTDGPGDTQITIGKTVTLTKNTGDAIVANDDALAFAKRKALASNKSKSAAAKRRAQKAGIDADDERDSDNDIIDEKDDDDVDGDGDGKNADKSSNPAKKLKTLKGDSSFIHYGGDCYVQSTQRPGGGTFDLVFQLYGEHGEYYPFVNTDARGLYAPGKEAALLRSKVAVARYLERDGMTEDDLRAVEMEASAFRASELAAAAPVYFEPREPRAARAAATKNKPLRDLDSDEELSDLLASDDEGYESESEEPLDKIEKIVYCCEAIEVDDAELEELGTEDAKKTAAEAKKKNKIAKGKTVYLYCVKWEGCSYRRRSWETAADIKAAYKADSKLQSFTRRHSKDPDSTTNPFPEDCLVVDRVIDVREALIEEDEEEEGKTPTKRMTPTKKVTPKKEKDSKKEQSNKESKKDTKGKKKGKKAEASDDEPSDNEQESELQYLVKWRGLGYSEATWEAAESLEADEDKVHIEKFELRDDLKEKKKVFSCAIERAKAGEKPPAKPEPPIFKNNMALREYQVTSFEWMVGNYRRRKNVILGDEMGLGKTAQCISVMEHVRTELLRAPRPFLVVAPLTTLGHWKREMEKWTDMNVVVLDGNAEDRRVCEETEFYFSSKGRGKGPAKFDVLLVSFETARRLTDLMQSFEWALCVVDEAHKLKDVNSQTTQSVMDIPYEWLLLLTGTPIQNNVRELFGMMHVLDPEKYPSWEEFQDEFCDGGREVDAEQVMRLRDVLKPRMLRRMKEDVETIPAKEEIVVWVELTPEQRKYYRAIYEKQVHVLLDGAKSKNVPQLRNLCMELRKVCNHPFLCDGLEEDYGGKRMKAIELAAEKAAALAVEKGEATPPAPTPPTQLDLLTGSSGKMTLIAKLLPRLKSQGKKVLIFSQFTIVLDLLEDYLQMMSYDFERLDGSTSQQDRQQGIDRFNKDGQGFVYLLSTRAGGMGITLTAADTAIIYDSDWNPQNDLQAMARCHRIGQTKEVKVYRLVTKATYEQSLFETSAKKYGLDEAVLGRGDDSSFGNKTSSAKDDANKINRLLKYGVHGALRDSSGEEAAKFANEDIDSILNNRAEHRAIGERKGNTFSTAVFNAQGDDEDFDAEDFWAKALPDAARRSKEDAFAHSFDPHGGLDDRFRVTGPRKRKGMYDSYKEGQGGMVGKKKKRKGEDDDFSEDESSDEDDSSFSGKNSKKMGGAGQGKGCKGKKASGKTDPWLDRDLKQLEDAIVAFGVGVDKRCVRASLAATELMSVKRSFKETRIVAVCLAEMIERTGKVNKARFEELEEQAKKDGIANGGLITAKCTVCESMKKGKCGTETAPRSCLNLSEEMKLVMDKRGGGVDDGGVPVGMSRQTWEQTVEVCEAAIEEFAGELLENALVSLRRGNLYKRLASGWQRALKCGKERSALSAALEEHIDDPDDLPVDDNSSPRLPAEKADFVYPGGGVQRGALPHWWSQDADNALLTGSLRHGFSPWSAEVLDKQFEKIREDEGLLFSELGAEPAPEVDKAEKKTDTEEEGKQSELKESVPSAGGKTPVDTSRVIMPGRETVKRRLLKLLDGLVNPREAPPAKAPKPPREVKARQPTKKEQKEAAREAAAVARKAADAERVLEFKNALTSGAKTGSKNGEASGVTKESPPGAVDVAADDTKNETAAPQRLSSPQTRSSPRATPVKRAAPVEAEVSTQPFAKKAKQSTPEKAVMGTTSTAKTTPAKSPLGKAKSPAVKAKSPLVKAKSPSVKAKSPSAKSPAAVAKSPAGRSPLAANTARASIVCQSPRGKMLAPKSLAKPAPLTDGQDPLATLVLPAFKTPGFKKGGKIAATSTGKQSKQASLVGFGGFFAKTPAANATAAPSARTPTTGGF